MGTNPVGGYAIELSESGGQFVGVAISQEGGGCERLVPNADADRTCRIATSLVPTLIASEAYGELNARRTPALDAMVWRARANADPTVCQRGGLSGAFLTECEAHATAADYEYTGPGIRIHVPIGGAIPASST